MISASGQLARVGGIGLLLARRLTPFVPACVRVLSCAYVTSNVGSTAAEAIRPADAAPEEPHPSLFSYRSVYSERVWDYIASLLPKPEVEEDAHKVVDIVAGAEGRTGVELAKRGYDVLVVSDNWQVLSCTFDYADVRNAAINIISGHGVVGDCRADLVTCMHGLHLLDTRTTLQQAHRILKPGGRLVAAWNDTDFGSLFMRELEGIAQRHVPHYSRSFTVHDMSDWSGTLEHEGLFRMLEHNVWANPVVLPSAAAMCEVLNQQIWLKRALEDAKREALVAEVRAFVEQCYGEGQVRVPMLTKLYVLERPAQQQEQEQQHQEQRDSDGS